MPIHRLVVAVALFLALPARAGDIAKLSLPFAGHDRTYYLSVPDGQAPAPLLLLLHGSGGNGLFMAQLWKDVGARQGIVLVAPNSFNTEEGWDLRKDGPDFIHAMVAAAAAAHPVDLKRLYVFGQSGGAVYSLTLGMLESEYFAAIAFHAGGWRSPAEYRAAALARRKIPISINVGDDDEYFSMKSIRDTDAVLDKAGFPVALNVLEGRKHSILDVPAGFNDGVWAFLSSHTLDGPPSFTEYH
ncbi:MAG TPA: dienelactone hydrolase family protein [Rhizomicrobium sp.]|nr:dienelactone hydrolase family protein [Rhizomicrobium sp.]